MDQTNINQKNIQDNSGSFFIDPADQEKSLLNILEDMQKEQQELEKQRLATLNILEDINEAQKELKGKYIESETLKNLIQKLGTSLEMRSVMSYIAEAIQKFFPEAIISYVVAPVGTTSIDSFIYISTKTEIGDNFLQVVEEKIKTYLTSDSGLDQKDPSVSKWLAGSFSFKFVEGAKSESSAILPLSSITIPMIIPDFLAGVFNVSLLTKGGFGKQEVYFVNTIVDNAITTIKRLKMLIDSEQSRLDDLLKSMTNGVLMFDINKRVIVVNPSIIKIAGIKKENFTLNNFIYLFEQENKDLFTKKGSISEKNDSTDLLKVVNKVLMSGDTIHLEEVKIKEGVFEMFITAVRDHKYQVAGGAIILHDITHLKEVDQMKTEFVSVASHQLRTPLTGINWYIEMLLSGDVGELPPKHREYLEEVYDGSQRMVKLVNELLNVSRLESGRLRIEPKMIQLEDFIQEIIDEAKPLALAKKCNCIFKRLENKLPLIPIDVSLMRQVIHNLITNALKYSSNDRCGIFVNLEIKNINPEQPNEQYVIVSVKDSGIGIPEDVQPRIFQKFFRADNAVRLATDGSGLGLYIAKMIIEASGGKIWFESKAGEGTTFSAAIPMKGMVKKEGEKGLS